MKHIRRLITMLALLIAGLAVPLALQPAAAVSCVSNFPWGSQHELINWQGSSTYDCERNFVTDPGRGELLDPNTTIGTNALLSPARMSFYGSKGFNANFMWYAPRTTIKSDQSDTRTWTACTVGVSAGQICPTLKVGPMGRDWTAQVTLDVIGDATTFIALACGNFSSDYGFNPPPVPNHVPYFEGVKFRDDNRDGVRNGTEQTISSWQIRIVRESSRVDQPAQELAVVATDATGYYRFDLVGHGPGRYRIEEIEQAGWKNYTPISRVIDVDFGVESRPYQVDFGNAETTADVAKVAMRFVNPPAHIDANAPTPLDVDVTVENLGPAAEVPIEDTLELTMPPDCTTERPTQRFTALLKRDAPVTERFTFVVTCSRPSEHEFTLKDVLHITNPDITDFNPPNNELDKATIIPVHAETDLSAQGALTCPPTTNVGTPITCTATITARNEGFDDVDATVVAALSVLADCVVSPDLATLRFQHLDRAGTAQVQTQDFQVTCSHRSDHPATLTVAIRAVDPHVFDRWPDNDTHGSDSTLTEVFHDASMSATMLHLTCDERIGVATFTCAADVMYSKTGPAPAVQAAVYANLTIAEGCSAGPAETQSVDVVLDDADAHTTTFTWTITCAESKTLHPFRATSDVNPRLDVDPHAVDVPGPIHDDWIVPYCLPTVNPHGQREPQAPGTGMNEDGFYVFGTLPSGFDARVSIRDNGSGVVFGPFLNGTRIKWVEANGTAPRQTLMGGNNGNGKGQALAVDYQILANGDAQAFFVDEKGVEVSVTCLVPPFPK